ncbi:MAG: excinuclease ABC subunit UvrC [Nanoarchaeota archaeon]|nr:excinuclease ABC subunit UvrC [Nanoarchaeota archaeon]
MQFTLPSNPGCYLFKDKKDRIIYIGKAKNLKKRVGSYFSKKILDPKTTALVGNIDDVDYIVTDSEVEALILENNLIKKHRPKYNINLLDAKRYAYIEIPDEKFPRLMIARKKTGKGSFFGPFTSAETRDYILELLRKSFKLRTCRRFPKKACLRYHIGLCDAPCIGLISREEYKKKLDNIRFVLKGNIMPLIRRLKKQMLEYSKQQEYERALEIRKQIEAVEWLEEKQNMERQKRYNEDIINYVVKDSIVYLMLFNIKKGILENKQEFTFDYNEDFFENFLSQYYSEHTIPKELILPKNISDALRIFLQKRKKTNVRVIIPEKGEKSKLLRLVRRNIEITHFGNIEKVEFLQKSLNLNNPPSVVECFDISHLSGTSTAGSMVQFRNGIPDKSNYRRFRIRSIDKIDDFAGIAEVVKRRYTRLKNEKQRFPDLIVIDGGKGQLSAALKELKELNLSVPIIALAKREEEIFTPASTEPIVLKKNDRSLLFLRQIRDEAHRFAIKYNKLLRTKETLK